jgi:threonine/homoserine/homoserine lactone efflux protein
MVWFAGIILATHHARRWLHSRTAGKLTDSIAGAVLIGFAAKIATTRA